MKSSPRRALAVASAALFAGASLAVAAPAASAIQIKTVGPAYYISVDDLAPHHFDAVEDVVDQINGFVPDEEEIVFAWDKRGPKTFLGVWVPLRSQNVSWVECDPIRNTWEDALRGYCNGNEESLTR